MSRPRRHTCLHLSYRTCRHHKTFNEQEQIKLLHRTRQDRQQLLLSNSKPAQVQGNNKPQNMGPPPHAGTCTSATTAICQCTNEYFSFSSGQHWSSSYKSIPSSRRKIRSALISKYQWKAIPTSNAINRSSTFRLCSWRFSCRSFRN